MPITGRPPRRRGSTTPAALRRSPDRARDRRCWPPASARWRCRAARVPTSSTASDWRAGPRKANEAPITIEPATSRARRMRPVAIAHEIAKNTDVVASWAIAITRRFGSRSANAPPSGPSVNIMRPCPKITSPTARLAPVRSKATTLCTVIDMKKPTKAKTVPIQRMRKLGTWSAAKMPPKDRCTRTYRRRVVGWAASRPEASSTRRHDPPAVQATVLQTRPAERRRPTELRSDSRLEDCPFARLEGGCSKPGPRTSSTRYGGFAAGPPTPPSPSSPWRSAWPAPPRCSGSRNGCCSSLSPTARRKRSRCSGSAAPGPRASSPTCARR